MAHRGGTEGRKDGRMEGRTDGRTDGRTKPLSATEKMKMNIPTDKLTSSRINMQLSYRNQKPKLSNPVEI